MSLSLVTAPAVEPLLLPEVKDHLKVSGSDDDAMITRFISAARQRCQHKTRRALITQTWDVWLDQWPTWSGFHGGRPFEPASTLLPSGGAVDLPKAPLQSVTYVKYVDLAGTLQTWDPTNYLVDAPTGDYCRRGRLSLGWVKVWPIVRPTANAIQIRIVCGYGADETAVPELLRQAMLMDVGMMHEHRSSVLSGNRAASIEIVSTTREIYQSFLSR